MGTEVTEARQGAAISWSAPIIPSVSLAGIPVGLDLARLEELLSRYLIEDSLYQFEQSPVLQLRKSTSGDDLLFVFSVRDRDLTNWRRHFNSPDHAGVDPRALGIVVRQGRVHAVKAWQFESLNDDEKPANSYRGKLPGNIGLGDQVSELMEQVSLNYDDAEGVLYAGPEYGGLEITGYGEPDDYPDQPIRAITVVPNA